MQPCGPDCGPVCKTASARLVLAYDEGPGEISPATTRRAAGPLLGAQASLQPERKAQGFVQALELLR